MYLVLLVIAIVIPGSLQDAAFSQCSNNKTEALSLQIDNCNDGNSPCKFIRGTTPTFSLTFLADSDITTLTAKVKAQALGVTTNYALPDDDGCSYLTNGECPLDEGEVVTYAYSMPISSAFPLVSVIVEYSLVSDSGATVACVKVSAEVTSS